jgi:hypothetical protein
LSLERGWVTAVIRALGLLLVIGALGGCAAQRAIVSGAPALQGLDAPLELVATPFHPQEALDCGPAALATVLGAAGVEARPDTLAREVFTPGLGGSLQLELVAAARARGFVPYVIAPELDALFAELLAGRPVLVLQNLRLRSWPAWHYAVVIGADPAAERVILRSGAERRLVEPGAKFLRSWDRADRWGLVLLAPGSCRRRPDRGATSRRSPASRTRTIMRPRRRPGRRRWRCGRATRWRASALPPRATLAAISRRRAPATRPCSPTSRTTRRH